MLCGLLMYDAIVMLVFVNNSSLRIDRYFRASERLE